jgi:glutamyl-tRNA reductase
VPGVVLADLDEVKREVLSERPAEAAAEVGQVQAIVAEEVGRFESWRRAARLAPLIQALRDRGNGVLAAELARLRPKLSTLSDREREAVEALGRGVVAKLLHDPIVRLKGLPPHGAGETYARALAELFGLEPPPRE